MLLADLDLWIVVSTGVGERNLEIGVLYLAVGHNFKILENLDVALVGVHDYVEIVVGAKHLGEHVAEGFFEHADHRGLVDVLEFLELGEALDHVGSFLFLSHFICLYFLLF